MTSVLYGMLGAVIVDGALVAAAVLAAPRLIRRAMRQQLGGFGRKPSGVALAGQYIEKAGSDDARP